MTPTARPTARPDEPTAAQVRWFGASHRKIAGMPDTRYGWLDTPSGQPLIVKALDTTLSSYPNTMLRNERDVLQRLGGRGAPVPTLVQRPEFAAHEGWLVTAFAGLSLHVMQGRAHHEAGLRFDEWLSAWIHFLQRARTFDDAGAVPVDLWSANLVLPLSHGIEGQALLAQPVLIDHAHTVVAGMNLRRPVWMDVERRRAAPELCEALLADQAALRHAFRLARADLPGQESPAPEAQERTRRLWAEYDEPQQLQRLLDSGRLNRGAAIQYAVGVALDTLANGQRRAYTRDDASARLAPVLRRLLAPQPQARFDTLEEAARALGQVLRHVPLVSEHRFGPVRPEDLMAAGGPSDTAKREDTRHWPTARPRDEPAAASGLQGEGTVHAGAAPRPSIDVIDLEDLEKLDEPGGNAASAVRVKAPRAWPLWLYLVAAAGAAVGTLMPQMLPPIW